MPKEISLRFELFSLNRVKSPTPHRQVDITDKVVNDLEEANTRVGQMVVGLSAGALTFGRWVRETSTAAEVGRTTEWFAKKTGKERASDIPSWAKGQRPMPGESGREFADRLCDERYGPGNYPTGPTSDHSKLKKFGDRGGLRRIFHSLHCWDLLNNR